MFCKKNQGGFQACGKTTLSAGPKIINERLFQYTHLHRICARIRFGSWSGFSQRSDARASRGHERHRSTKRSRRSRLDHGHQARICHLTQLRFSERILGCLSIPKFSSSPARPHTFETKVWGLGMFAFSVACSRKTHISLRPSISVHKQRNLLVRETTPFARYAPDRNRTHILGTGNLCSIR